MALKQQIEQDIKTAMLAGDKTLVTTLRGLKSVILYAEVAKSSREQGLGDAEIIELFSKEAKKRQESAELYSKGGRQDQAEAEVVEKQVIERYLPQQLTEDQLQTVVDEAIEEIDASGLAQMGQVIAAVRSKTAGAADGAQITQLVKARLQP